MFKSPAAPGIISTGRVDSSGSLVLPLALAGGLGRGHGGSGCLVKGGGYFVDVQVERHKVFFTNVGKFINKIILLNFDLRSFII